jgi:hypothetical protein
MIGPTDRVSFFLHSLVARYILPDTQARLSAVGHRRSASGRLETLFHGAE